MTSQPTPTHETEWLATVAVRVPRDGGTDLAADARRRLERPACIESVAVEGLEGLEPALAATVATLSVRVGVPDDATPDTVADRLADAPGTQRVERLNPA